MSFRPLATLVLVALVGAANSAAQETVRIPSGEAEINLAVWRDSGVPVLAAVLVPGWGGGPSDVLGTAEFLSGRGVPAVVLTPRGWHQSGGVATFANALEDIGAAVRWAREEFGPNVVLGGHSWGGGMSLAYASQDESIRRVFSLAGTDHAQLIRQYQGDPAFKSMVNQALTASAAPRGPIRTTVADLLVELDQGQLTYGLVENAEQLATRSLLLVGGWEDVNVTVDATLLPLYRALVAAGATDTQFTVYHTDHSFGSVREELHADLLAWLDG